MGDLRDKGALIGERTDLLQVECLYLTDRQSAVLLKCCLSVSFGQIL